MESYVKVIVFLVLLWFLIIKLRSFSKKKKFEQKRLLNKQYEENKRRWTSSALGTCEFCERPGAKRHYEDREVTCLIHNNRIIRSDGIGFSVDNPSKINIDWDEIEDATLELVTDRGPNIWKIKFIISRAKAGYEKQNNFTFWANDIGFGELLGNIPKGFNGLNYEIIETRFSNPKACPICGYLALYLNHCECCEWDTYETSEYKDQMSMNELEYNKDSQMWWKTNEANLDPDDNPYHIFGVKPKILFTKTEYEDYRKERFEEGW